MSLDAIAKSSLLYQPLSIPSLVHCMLTIFETDGIYACRPIADIEEAVSLVRKSEADVLLSVGGGSPIDAAKAIAYQIHKQTGKWLPSIAVPTTLSVAETTQGAGYTNEQGQKAVMMDSHLTPAGRYCSALLLLSLGAIRLIWLY